MNKRFSELTASATDFANDDVIALDGETNGTRKMSGSALKSAMKANTLATADSNAYVVSDGDVVRIKDLSTSITDFRTGDVIPVDGPDGTAKMPYADLLQVTTEHAVKSSDVQCIDFATNKGFISADGTIKVDNNWKYSNKIKIGENKLSVTLYGYTNSVRSVEFFDSEDSVVGYYIHDAIGMFTIKDMDVPENAVTFRFSMQTTNQQSVSDSSVVLFTEGIKTISERLDDVEPVTKTAREDVFILKTDSEFVIADKMFYAYRKGNCDVHWENGTYEFREVFDYIHTEYEGKNHNELPIGGNCRYYFNGSTLIGHKTSTDEFVVGNSSILGSHRAGGSYELHDGKLTSYGLVYCVHDECNGSTKESRRLYKNMIMDSTPNYENSTTISKCIGGGSGINHVVTIDNCIFNNHNKYNRPDVSYHGHTSSVVIDLVSQFTLNVYNSFFEHYVSLNALGNNEDAFAVVNNCSFGNNVDNGIEVTDSKWQVKNFMNEIRNSSL